MILRNTSRGKFNVAFTLIEIMVVLFVIAALAAMIIPHKYRARVHMISGRNYLYVDQKEPEGFGLYSYVLLPERPSNDRMKKRFAELYKAFSRTMESAKDYLAMGVDKEDINLTYWMLRLNDKDTEQKLSAKDEDFFVENYDYVRARIILSHIKGLNGSGPFIVSYSVPLGSGTDIPEVERDKLLVLDFSNKHEDLFVDVFRTFQMLVADRSEMWKGKFVLEEIRLSFYSLLKENADKMIYLAEVVKKIRAI